MPPTAPQIDWGEEIFGGVRGRASRTSSSATATAPHAGCSGSCPYGSPGSLWFASHPPPPLNADEAPHWQPAIYTLDLLLPVLDLGQEAAWRTSGASQWIALFLIILGWLLATIVTASAAADILRPN